MWNNYKRINTSTEAVCIVFLWKSNEYQQDSYLNNYSRKVIVYLIWWMKLLLKYQFNYYIKKRYILPRVVQARRCLGKVTLTIYGVYIRLSIIIIIIIIIIKKAWQCKAGRERLTPYQSKDPSQTIPTHRMKEEKSKTAGDKKGAST